MATYRVNLTQEVLESATVVVEAESPEEAEYLALTAAKAGDVDWRFFDAQGPIDLDTMNLLTT